VRKIHLKAASVYILAIMIFLAIRVIVVPPSFGELTDDYNYRWFRADSVREIMELDMKFAAKEMCESCHSDKVEFLNRGAHSTISCETCHGPSIEHVRSPGDNLPEIDTSRALCKLCHDYNPTRPEGFPQIFSEEHGYGRQCVDCHNPHSPWVFRGGAEQ